MIKLYPDRTLPAFLRIVSDLITIAWTVAWAALGWLIYETVLGLEVIADGITNTGTTFNAWIASFRNAIPSEIPLLTPFLRDIADALRKYSGDSLVSAGHNIHNAIIQLAIVLALLVDVEPLYWHRYTSVALVTPRGVVYASPDKVLAYRSALEFIDQKKNEGASIMSVPEDISLYFLAGIECPTRIYQFGPGVLAPGKMTNQEIASIEQAGVRYLIWSNRTFPEYGVPVFGTDFDQVLGQYFRSHYRPVKAIGKDRGWNAVIWERSPASSDR